MAISVLGAKRGLRAALLPVVLAVVAAPLAIAAPAQAAATHLVISEAYGGGGNAGAPYTNDFVELYNPTNAAIDLTGMSIQYRSATNTGTGVHVLSGSIAAHSHFLVAEGGGAVGEALPNPDLTGSLNMSATNGTVFLASTVSAVTLVPGTSTANAAVVDLVGFGSSNTFETTAAGVLSNTTAASRNADRDDNDNNSTDFTVGAPDPQNSGAEPVDPGPGVEKTIEEVQGSGSASPLAGIKVITKGVVTASYPTGGFKGFYLQTPGTGGELDLGEHTTSNAVFVYAGSIPAGSYPALGSYVQVTGTVSEFNGLTEISPGAAANISTLPDAVTAPTPASATWPGGAAQRESLEGMLYEPTGPWTVSEVYNLNTFGEIELARGSAPLRTPTDVARPKTPAAAAVAAQNAAKALTLDDGSTANYLTTAKDVPLPWITASSSVRVGAPVTFTKPVIVDYRNDAWKIQPTAQLDAADTQDVRPVTFADTRTSKPDPVEGQLKVASFNVLNYFTETAADWTGAAAGNTCTSYKDRAGVPVAVDTCSGDGPRGAWDQANRQRQQDKIVKAINALGADTVSLEEIENSAKYGADRDAALSTLVDALNADAGGDVWTFVPSPNAAQRPAVADEDVIRTAFIYKNAKVAPVGPSRILTGAAAFNNAREPLAQVFKPKNGTLNQQFLVVVNHFKSKGSGTGADADQGDGQGASNASRVNQAKALVDWVGQLRTSTATKRVFLTGDFNSYTQEDPMKVLYDAGYTDIGSTLANEYTYVFDGAVGSLDHVLGNADAMTSVQGASVWNINSVESVAYEYSRRNYNATDFYVANPYRSSDHDPLVVGFDNPAANDDTVPLNLLNINDFHGRIDANTNAFATTVEQLREAGGEDNTLFMAAGDNIGASLFASASADDNPTIDVLNALGMDAASVGNHEFDKGFTDLTGHVTDRADWKYLGANVYEKGTQTPALPEYEVITKGGLKVGVIGAVTQETPSLVTPGGISTLDFGDPVAAVNRVASQLTDGNEANGEADVLVAEFHAGAGEGAPDGATFEEELASGGEFAHIVNDLTPKVAAIFTGHTHKQYAWDAPIPGQAGKTRPIMQTGEYGNNVGQIRLLVDKNTHAVSSYSQAIVKRGTAVDTGYPRVAAVKAVVDNALAAAATVGNVVKGSVTADITTAYAGGSYVDGKYQGSNPADPKAGRDARELESTIGNKVADALLDNLDENGAEIGVVNPGGLRDELFYKAAAAEGDGNVTFAEANAVLPFVNNLWTVDLTGAQLKKVLEQQWQPAGSSRPFLHLGLSKNVSVTLEPGKPVGERVASVRINGEPLDPTRTYTIGTFSFLATGGDNFLEFKNGTNAVDTGKVDRDAWISYLQAHSPLSPDFDRREVEGSGFPAEIEPGDDVSFGLSRLDLTSIGSPLNTTVTATLDTPGADSELGSFPVTNGAATVAFTAPASVPEGSSYVVTAQPSGTTVTIPAVATVVVPPGPADTQTTATISTTRPVVRATKPVVTVNVTDPGGLVTGGTVQVAEGSNVLGTATVTAGVAKVTLPAFRSTGAATLTVRYLGTPTENPSQAANLKVVVVPAAASLSSKVAPSPVKRKKAATLTVRVSAANGPVTGYVSVREKGKVIGLVRISAGKATLRLPKYPKKGSHAITVTFLGNDVVAAKAQVVRFRVV
ncbi:ExeM/NucH family extracellular endonuclease [Nocardioides marmoriginsengisoli]|uniref:ExeM/NucH family extracellular endonuclease n=1 Tax=Nocardioides marmoriginsengisoli TaxID=661483 RepID=A0A3N0CG47_9ACTN|nr:ExeM/NucH family extracellular endonuclease [Nocardioides marmoriginsengisoli]RNL61986.1 ExeM/NucH family extracellular endonuclease [Nocardioides marmoriginsengisoli]